MPIPMPLPLPMPIPDDGVAGLGAGIPIPELMAGLGAGAEGALAAVFLRRGAALRAGARFLAAFLAVRLAGFLALVDLLAADFRTFFAFLTFFFAIMSLLQPRGSERLYFEVRTPIVHHPERLQADPRRGRIVSSNWILADSRARIGPTAL
ncbi:MAG: hypothetical protein WD040_04445 [Anaerolineales bacterium]